MTFDYSKKIFPGSGLSPFQNTVLEALRLAREQKQRLTIEIRSQEEGYSASRQEHRWILDAKGTTANELLHQIATRLEESPGEDFSGLIRISFTPEKPIGLRYGLIQLSNLPLS